MDEWSDDLIGIIAFFIAALLITVTITIGTSLYYTGKNQVKQENYKACLDAGGTAHCQKILKGF